MRIFTVFFYWAVILGIAFGTLTDCRAQRTYGSSQQTGAGGVLCVNCVVNNAANAADANLQSFSTLRVTLGIAAQTYQEVIFPASVAANTPVSLKLGSGDDLLSLQALGAISIRPYNGAVPAGAPVTAGSLLTALSNNNQVELTITPTQTYDRVRVTLNGGLVGALNSLYLYEAYYKGNGPAPCNSAIDELHGISSALLGLGLGVGGVQNPQLAIDGSLETYSTLNAGVGLLGAYTQQMVIFNNTSVIGDSVRLTLSMPQALIDAGVLGNIEISTYNGNFSNNDTRAFNSSLLTLRLLDLNGPLRTVTVTYAPSATFDRVQLRLGGGIANVLSSLNLHEAQRVLPSPKVTYNAVAADNVQLCTGNTANLVVTAMPNTVYNWYTTATGGAPIFTGASFTTPALTTTTTYYVEAVRNGCTDASARTRVIVNVNPIPAAPVIANTTTTVCPGQPATFTAESVAGVTVNWYTAATGGTPVFTGNSFTTAALNANATYYAEAVAGGSCVSTARTQVTATVAPLPAAPTLASNDVNICSGEVAVLNVASPVNGVQYRWYTSATNGTLLYTGNSFTTPVLSANATYYVEGVSVTGCPSAARTQANVIVQPNPANPTLAANNTTITAGQTAAIMVTNAQTGVSYNWYTSAAAATPIFTGSTFITPALYATTTYYVGAVNSTGCQSDSRTAITINVNINNNSPCSFANLQSSNVNGICIGCGVSNNLLATDADTTTASTISVLAGLVGGYAEQELRFQNPGYAGDTIKLRLQTPVGLADASLLGQIEVALYNGGTEIARYALSNSLLSLSLLGGNIYNVYVPATATYDRVTIRLNSGVLSALTSVRVFYAMQQFAKPVFAPASPEICRGSTAQINITSPANGGTFDFYDVPTGGTPVYTGTAFTTPPLNANATYYIEYTRNGCSNGTRTPVQVLVNDIPAKPVIAQDNVTINSGQTATFEATAPANATVRWYTTPTNGTPIFTGDTFITPPLTANTTYYAESALGSCVSPDRTPVTVNVNQVIPDITVTPPTRTINPGETASFTASSTTPNVTFNWYTTPTGGVPVFSGPNFTSPPTFGNTTYYAEAVDNSTGITSPTRATATITVNNVASNQVPCDAAIDQTTDINGLVCLGCSVNNAAASVDNDRNTFSRLNVPVGLLNAYAAQTLRFANTGRVGDSVVVELGVPGSLADVAVLSGISLATYNGNIYNNDRFTVNGTLLSINLLNGQSRFRIAFAAQSDFDRVEIRLNAAVAGVFSSLNIYDAYQEVAAPVVAVPTVTACEGSQATLTATVPPHVTVKWYTSPTGGSPIFTGSTFTTPAITANTIYYAEASRTSNGCTQGVRTPVTVNMAPIPAAPSVATPNVTVCSGQPATFTAQSVSGITINWYTTATGGTPVFTGDTFTSGPLTATTSFYAEAVSAGSCNSTTRTQVTATVSAGVNDPVVAQNPVQACAGTTAILTASSNQPGVTFNWYSAATGGTPIYSGAQYTTPILTANATYYVEAAAGSCISPNRVAVDVVVNPTPAAPTVSMTPSSGQISSGQTATLNASSTTPGTEFRWYTSASGGSPIFTGPSFTTPALTSNTTYFVESVVTATGCTSSTRTPITVIVNPIFSTSCDFASSQSTAVGGVLCVLCGVVDPSNAVDTDTTNFSRLTTTAGLGGAYVSQSLIFGDAGAVGDTVTIKLRFPVNIVALGVLDRIRIASYNGGTFNNDEIYLNNNLVKVQILAGGQTALIKFAPQAAFDRVEVRLESAVVGLFDDLDIFYATKQIEAPQLAASTQNICEGGSATFTVSNARAGVLYEWFTTPTGGTAVASGASFTATGLTTTTTYYVQSTRIANGCVNPNRVAATANVTHGPVNPIITNNAVTVCAGDQVILAVSNANGATINWYDAPTGGTLVFTGANFAVTPIATVSYYAEAVNGTCTSPARTPATITVNPRPLAPAVAAANVGVCAGSTATLQVQNPEAGITYTYFNVPTGGTALGTGTSYQTTAITSTTTYYIQATSASGCANNGGRTQVTVTPNGQVAAPTLSATTTQVCSGGSAAISVVNPIVGIQYNWYNASGTLVYTGTTFTVNNLTASTSYFVEASNGNGCTSPTRTQTDINVLAAPTPPMVQASAGGMSVCEGSSTTLSIANPQPDLVYRWFNSLNGGTLLFTGTVFTTPPLTANTTYYVEASSAGNCNPSARTTAAITINTLPSNVTLTSNNVSACAGGSATISVASPQNGVIYQWFDSPGLTNKVYEGTTFVTGPLYVNTNYYVSAVSTAGCRSANLTTAQVSILPNTPAPVIANGGSMQACAGLQVVLTISNPEPGYTYNWYTSATGGTIVGTGSSFTTPVLTTNVSYFAEAVNGGGCASSSRSGISITVNATPTAPTVTAPNVSICAGSTANLSVTPVAGINVNWYTVATGGTAIATGNSFTTPALNANTTYYVEAVNASGCASSPRKPVVVSIIQQLATPVVSVANVTTTSVTFQYNSVPGATGYEVSTNNGASFTAPSSGTTGLSHTVTGLQPNQSVSLTVRAMGASGCQLSANSLAVTGTTANPFGDGIFVPNAFSPNGDGQNDVLYVYGNSIKSMKFWVYDQYGEMQFNTTNRSDGWNGTWKGRQQPVGVYVYYLEATTNDGNIIKKKGTITLLR